LQVKFVIIENKMAVKCEAETKNAAVKRIDNLLQFQIQLIGAASLRVNCAPVIHSAAAFASERMLLLAALDHFRKINGFGRAISAPQIGITKRFIALNLGREPFLMINPVITAVSREKTFTLWDDCMSIPWLMMKVRRYETITVEFEDEKAQKCVWQNVEKAISELLQHEIDHLQGVLCLDRVEDITTGVIAREEYQRNKQKYDSIVDYYIVPTITQQ